MQKFSGRVERISGHLPDAKDLVIPVRVWRKIGNSIADGIAINVLEQAQADGAPLKKNAPSTIKAKKARLRRRIGGRLLSLVHEQGRFIAARNYNVEPDEDGVTVWPKASAISDYVQRKGYKGWIGISKRRWVLIREILVEWINKVRKVSGA